LSDYALQFGLALVVLTVGSAAVIMSRRNYIKSADFERSIDALRLEFRRSIDAAQAATIKSAETISKNGEKARKDSGILIDLFVKRLKKVNASTTETALRLGDLESYFRPKPRQLVERHGEPRPDFFPSTRKNSLQQSEGYGWPTRHKSRCA
jgi:hypothetical protein